MAWLSPLPDRVTDRDVYEATARFGIVPDCTDLHCFRVLVAWGLGALPGMSLAKWKIYAVICNAVAAVAVGELAPRLGVSAAGSRLAVLLTAGGFGSLYTLHDVYTSDPLMFALGPVMMQALIDGRAAVAGMLGTIGVFGKEFAAVPLFVAAAWHGLERHWEQALASLSWALLAFIVWLVLQLTLILQFNYGYGDNPSTHLLGGGYLLPWIQKLSPRGAASALFNEYGALYLLAPAGWWIAGSSLRRLVVVSLPVALLFAYVQQPDRALWNFHFLAVPLSVLVLEQAPGAVAWTCAGLFVLANLKVGSQLPMAPNARFGLALSCLLAAGAVATALRAHSTTARAELAG